MSAEVRFVLALTCLAIACASLAVFIVRVSSGLVTSADGAAVLALALILVAGVLFSGMRVKP